MPEDSKALATLCNQLDQNNRANFILQILEEAKVGISITDSKRNVIYFNKNQEEISGPKKLGEPCFRSCTPYAYGFCEECQMSRSKDQREFTTHFRNGRYYDVYHVPIKNSGGKEIATAKISKEVTDRETLTDLKAKRQGTMPLHERIDLILKFILKMGFSRVRMFMVSEDGKYLTGYAVQGQKDQTFIGQMELIYSDEFTAKSFQENKLQVHKTDEYKGRWLDSKYISEWVDVPLLKNDVPVALVTIDNYDENYPDITLNKISPISEEALSEVIKISDGIIDAINSDLEIRKQPIEKMLSDVHKDIPDKTATNEIYECMLNSLTKVLEDYWGHVYRDDDKNLKISGLIMEINGSRLNRTVCTGSFCEALPLSFSLIEDKNIPEVHAANNSNCIIIDDVSKNSIWDEFTKHTDTDNSSKYKKNIIENGIHSFACFPIKSRDNAIGIISFYSQKHSLINDYIKITVNSFTQICVPILSQLYDLDEVRQRYSKMKGLAKVIDHLLMVKDDRDKLIWIMLTGLTHHEGLAYNRAIFLDYIQDTGYKARIAVGPENSNQATLIYNESNVKPTPLKVAIENAEKANEKLTQQVKGRLIPSAVFLKKPNLQKWNNDTLLDMPYSDYIPFSLWYNTTCYGGLWLDNFYTGGNPTDEDKNILDFAGNIFALLLHNLQANNEINDLLSMIFHRLRTDIAGPLDSTKLAEANNDISYINLPLMKAKLWEIFTNTNDLLSFSRYRIEKAKPMRKEINVREMVSQVINHFSTNRRFVNSIPQDISIFAEQHPIEHAFVNLIDNAIKYSQDGSSIVIEHQYDGDCIRFTIKNDVENPFDCNNTLELFERFKKGANSKGEGLGLYIVKEIAEQHGGKVFCEIKDKRASFGFSIQKE